MEIEEFKRAFIKESSNKMTKKELELCLKDVDKILSEHKHAMRFFGDKSILLSQPPYYWDRVKKLERAYQKELKQTKLFN